jgi:small GTP-binding protein
MITKKICMLGEFAVGKTSLVKRYVESLFSDIYKTTIGVKVDKKELTVGDKGLTLMLWDIEGRDPNTEIQTSYLRGAAGLIIVIDITRRRTIEAALDILSQSKRQLGEVPYIVAANKRDLSYEAELNTAELRHVFSDCIEVVSTSAKEDIGVDALFLSLAKELLRRQV